MEPEEPSFLIETFVIRADPASVARMKKWRVWRFCSFDPIHVRVALKIRYYVWYLRYLIVNHEIPWVIKEKM